MHGNSRPHTRLGCSTISFRHLDLCPGAGDRSPNWAYAEIDLGALPGVCDHVPYVLDAAAVDDGGRHRAASGLRVRSINGDVGDLNRPLDADGHAARDRHLDMLLTLAAATGARALVLPCGALDHTPIDHSTTTSTSSPPSSIARGQPARTTTASSCGPSRCTSTGCAGTSNARSH